jgi:hypothetical protein
MKIKLLATSIALAALSSVAMAADKQVGSGPNPYSDCGIGAALFPEHKVLAVTSNVIWDIGTTAVTSATASPETCSGKKATAAKFILESYESLAEETARGQGEHLAALMNILEVDAAKQAGVIANLRAQMSEKVTQPGYNSANKLDKSNDYYTSVMTALTAV